MNIAIFGHGAVGSGIKEIIDHVVTKSTRQLHVPYILIRKGRAKTLSYMCDGIRMILQDISVDIIVEAMGGLESVHTYILQASRSGKHVTVANKAVIAAYLEGFIDVTREHNVRIYYETNTGGGIPWIEGLAKAIRADEVDRIHGIFSGTSNYILDHVRRYHASFGDILREAQELGYTEADPSADIDGYDICDKLRISVSLTCGYHIPDTFPVFGTRSITKQDVSCFSSLGYAMRLIAKTQRSASHYGCVVQPVLFEAGSLESSTQDDYSLTALHGRTVGDLKFSGQGAEKLPTANAIIQGLIDLKEGVYRMGPSFTNTMSYDETLCLRDYILHADKAAHDELQDFSCEVKTSEGQEHLHIQKAEVYEIHWVMKRMLKTDVHTFVASIYEREDDQQYDGNNKI